MRKGHSRWEWPLEIRYVTGLPRQLGLALCRLSSEIFDLLWPAWLYITGAYVIAIHLPFSTSFRFSHLLSLRLPVSLQSWRSGQYNPKIHNNLSYLATRTEMSTPSGKLNPPDGRRAAGAGLACTLVNAVLELEEALIAVCVDVVGDRRAAEANGPP